MAPRLSEMTIIDGRINRLSEELSTLHARHAALGVDQRKFIANIELAKQYLTVISTNKKNFRLASIVSIKEYANLKTLEERNKLALQHATSELGKIRSELIEYQQAIKELEAEMAELVKKKNSFGRVYEFSRDNK